MEIYIVQPSDSVDSIAERLNVNVEQLIYENQLRYPYELAVGQALFISGGGRAAERAISVCGYAYPFIDPEVLEETLPYLSELPVFSYGFTSEGELLAPVYGEDDWMIAAAVQNAVKPVLTLAPLGPDGRFHSELISSVVNDPQYRDNLIQNLLILMGEKGYQGLDIDFEYILPEDRDAFTEFVRRVAQAMRAEGYTTSVALAPKTSDDQTGILYAGMDYRGLGEAADYVLLMTYEWGYTYGPPMAVAPINQVRQVVEYALTRIPAQKINLGIPNYGYDWPLPYVRGVTTAETLGNVEAVRLAAVQGAQIRFDDIAQSPAYGYIQEEIEHEVWFEDVRSILEKLELIREYGLRGCSYWQIMKLFRANWLLLENQFYILKES